MLARTITSTLKASARSFPAVVLTGPRQSGKTTLLQHVFGKTHTYISLENPDIRQRLLADPVAFIRDIQKGVILDEIQQIPELFSYIKSSIDKDRKPGKWIITGSQNFALMRTVSESLAGRAAILTLLPFSVAEMKGKGAHTREMRDALKESKPFVHMPLAVDTILWKGLYPELSTHKQMDRDMWLGSYINTYLERDIRNLQQVGDLRQYEVFLRACAMRTGQILDISGLARDVGISFTTAQRWLSLLETGYQVFFLQPYYKNYGKRLTKRPKLYFVDVGIASYLLGFRGASDIVNSSLYGALFETLVVSDMFKRYLHCGQSVPLYYVRTHDDLEVDVVIEESQRLTLVEIKSTQTLHPSHASSILRLKREWGDVVDRAVLLSNAHDALPIAPEITHIPVESFLMR